MGPTIKGVRLTIDGKEFTGIQELKFEYLTTRERTERKLIELLEGIDTKTATPEMLMASARIAEVLQEY